jgi:hypothetical protein
LGFCDCKGGLGVDPDLRIGDAGRISSLRSLKQVAPKTLKPQEIPAWMLNRRFRPIHREKNLHLIGAGPGASGLRRILKTMKRN